MDPRRRRELTRYGAPTAFLAAVTIAVLLIKSGLDQSSTSQPTTSAGLSTHAARTTKQRTTKLVLTAPTATTTSTTATTTATTATTTATTTGTTTSSTTATTVAGAQYYVVKSGDTLGGIAAKYHTTVAELMRLNPQVNPAALQPGDQIRVS